MQKTTDNHEINTVIVTGLPDLFTFAASYFEAFNALPLVSNIILYGNKNSIFHHQESTVSRFAKRAGWNLVRCNQLDDLPAIQTSNLWIHSIHKSEFTQIIFRVKYEQLYFYDNGLSSYWNHTLPTKTGDRTKIIVTKAFLSLIPALSPPEYLKKICTYQAISGDSFGKIYSWAYQLLDVRPIHLQHIESLILGSSLYRQGGISWEEERGIYLSLTQWLQNELGSSPYFIHHPRSLQKPLLQESDGVVVIENSLPCEAMLLDTEISSIFSISSTSLFLFKKLKSSTCYILETLYEQSLSQKSPHTALNKFFSTPVTRIPIRKQNQKPSSLIIRRIHN